jgi:hypothetical protein
MQTPPPPHPQATLYRSCPLVDYKVTLHTSDQGDAGFDGEVLVTMQVGGVWNEAVLLPVGGDTVGLGLMSRRKKT